MKETGGYYRPEFHAMQWRCNEHLTLKYGVKQFCDFENHTPVRFGWGTHILTCKNCGTKRKVTAIEEAK
jgi:hypothetical protein